jgi:hypothetical protein
MAPLTQIGGVNLNIWTYLPVFARVGLSSKATGKAEAGGFFKSKSNFGIIYNNGYSESQCNDAECKAAIAKCPNKGWYVAYVLCVGGYVRMLARMCRNVCACARMCM